MLVKAMHLKLVKADPIFKPLVRAHGPLTVTPKRGRWQPYQSLVRAIAYQQLHGKAAETIFNRFLARFDGQLPTPEQIMALHVPTFRACGFSASKTAAIKDIARHTLKGTVPTRAAALKMSNEELIERLIAIKGVGRWTVEMFLIFTLGRTDVLSAGDFGVRNGYRIAAKLPAMPTEKELAAIGERWAPYGSLACLYLWRAADAAKEQKTKTPKTPSKKKKA
jgi:DNA-3-methyladenine glycosylase II